MEEGRLQNLQKILKNEEKIPQYIGKILKLIEHKGQQQVFEAFNFPTNEAIIEGQRFVLQKILDYMSISEDPTTLLSLLKVLIIWTSSHNTALNLSSEDSSETSFTDFKARLVLELSALDQRFPASELLKPVSQHVLRLASSCLAGAHSQLSPDLIQDLLKLLTYHKSRLLVETSDLAREVRAQQEVGCLESMQIQLSQIQSLEMQIKHFRDKMQPLFIQVCQEMIQKYEERQLQPLLQEERREVERDEKEILLSLAKILETLIAQTHYLLKLKTTQSQDHLHTYLDPVYQQILGKNSRKIYKAFAFGINALITRHTSYKIQAASLRLLKRYWELQGGARVLEDTIITCLQNFAEFEDIQKHKVAALFYYHLLNSSDTNEQFKQKLKEDKNLDILKFNPNFSSIFYLHQVEQEQAYDLKSLIIKSGFTLQETIAPKQNFKQYIQVTKPQSILHYNFTTIEYNIGFSVERVGNLKIVQRGGWEEQNNEEIVRYSICDSHLKPISGSVLLVKPGVYKAVWHNSFSYLKAKQLKYRLRVLERKDLSEETNGDQLQISDLFTINDLSEKEDAAFKALRTVYPEFVPIVKIVRNAQLKNQTENQQSLVLLIEENRSYLRLNKPSTHDLQTEASDIYVQQLNHKQLDQAEYDATKFFSDDSPFTQVFILTQLKDYQLTSTNPQTSHFQAKHKSQLRDYVVKAEKILYFTLEKTQFKNKINTNAEFYFADSCDSLICSDLYSAIFKEGQNDKAASIYNCGDLNLLLTTDKNKEQYQVRNVSDLMINQKSASDHHQDRTVHMEYITMIFSYLKITMNLTQQDIKIYEDDSGLEIPELEERLLTLREEALRNAVNLKDIYNLFRKGNQSQK